MDKINYYYLVFITILLTVSHSIYAQPPEEKTTDSVQVGQVVADNGFLYRKIIAINQDKSYQVQNFYRETNTKQSNVFIILDKNNLNIFQELHIYNLRNLIFQGLLTLYSKEGKQSMSMVVNQGNAEGLFTKYYTDTDSKEIEGYLYQGKPDGLWIYSSPNGTIEKKVYYKNGIAQWQYDIPQLPMSPH